MSHGRNRKACQSPAAKSVPHDVYRRYARAVLVDMEPKVINRAVVSAANSPTDWCFAPNSSLSQQSGSGNNWVRGYNGYGPKFASAVCELVRREVKHDTSLSKARRRPVSGSVLSVTACVCFFWCCFQ